MKKKVLITAAALVCAAAMAVGAAAASIPKSITGWHSLSRATLVWEKELVGETEEVKLESSILENAIREYFGLSEDEILTADMAAQVEYIDFVPSLWQDGLVMLEGYEDKYAVKCIINGGAVIADDGQKLPSYNEQLFDFDEQLFDLMNGVKGVIGYEVIPVMARSQYLDLIEKKITDEFTYYKFDSFYTRKTLAGLDAEGIAYLTTLYPCVEVDEFAVVDPLVKPREMQELLRIAFAFGVANEDTILDSGVIEIPSSDYDKLPGLILVTADEGLTVETVD